MIPFDQSYPRDLVGYGAHMPDPKWPGGARIAINFALNYEAGGELNVLHGDATSESLMTDFGLPPVEGARSMLTESAFEYGSRRGVWTQKFGRLHVWPSWSVPRSRLPWQIRH